MRIIKTIELDQIELYTREGWTFERLVTESKLVPAHDIEANGNPALATWGQTVAVVRHHVIQHIVALVSKPSEVADRESELARDNETLRHNLKVFTEERMALDDRALALGRDLEAKSAGWQGALTNWDREKALRMKLEGEMGKVKEHIGILAWKAALDG